MYSGENKMKQNTKNNVKKVAMVSAVAAGLVAAGFAGAYYFPNEITKEVVTEKIVYQNVTVEVPGETVEVIKEVEKIVEVDNGNLDVLLNEIYDNNGNVAYLVDDLDDDEIDQIVDRIAFANDAKAMAIAEVKSQLFDELDGEVVALETLDEDDMERLRVDDDLDEIILSDIDFDNKDADVKVTGTFEQNDIKYNYEVEIEVKDGEVEDFNIISVTLA
jgi:hypothetical protein